AGSGHAGKARAAVTTTEADGKPGADARGRSGKRGDNNTAERSNRPRKDRHSTADGGDSKPGRAGGGYAAGARDDNNETRRRGDLV
ncbi:peptidase M23, partial [Mycobacterium tuberculosis]